MSSRCWTMCAVSIFPSSDAIGEAIAAQARARPRRKLAAAPCWNGVQGRAAEMTPSTQVHQRGQDHEDR